MVRIQFVISRLRAVASFSFASIAVCILIRHNIHMHFKNILNERFTYHFTLDKVNIPSLRIPDLKIRETNILSSETDNTSLLIIPWSNRSLLSNSSKPRYKLFQPLISSLEHQTLLKTFRVFKKICERSNLTHMLYGGSLLGSYRHHGLIPWDDDIDILMNETQKPDIIDSFKTVAGYNLCTPENRQWKFYKSDIRIHDHCSEHMWPYVDIFFFSENETHIWDNNEMYKYVYSFKKTNIFPLTVGLFEGDFASVPRKTSTILQQSYNIDLCVNSVYSHKQELVRKGTLISLPCKRVFSYFPFVFRTCEDHYIHEFLIIDQTPMYKISTDDQC